MDVGVDLTAYVPKNILDLLSAFLPNRRADIGKLRRAIEEGDWERLREIAERMYAVGNPYGFRQITTFGRLMRQACAEQDEPAFRELIDAYADYLSRVTVVEVDEPVIRHVLSPESRRALTSDDDAPDLAQPRRRRAPKPSARDALRVPVNSRK